MFDRSLRVVTIIVALISISWGVYGVFESMDSILSELLFGFSLTSIFLGIFLIAWASKGTQMLTNIIRGSVKP